MYMDDYEELLSDSEENCSLGELRPSSRVLRTGKWTKAEAAFTNRIIEEFKTGTLDDCPEGYTLRSYLAIKLNCSPMRISKKLAGLRMGKNAFRRKPDEFTKGGGTSYLRLLERAFLETLTSPKEPLNFNLKRGAEEDPSFINEDSNEGHEYPPMSPMSIAYQGNESHQQGHSPTSYSSSTANTDTDEHSHSDSDSKQSRHSRHSDSNLSSNLDENPNDNGKHSNSQQFFPQWSPIEGDICFHQIPLHICASSINIHDMDKSTVSKLAETYDVTFPTSSQSERPNKRQNTGGGGGIGSYNQFDFYNDSDFISLYLEGMAENTI